MSDGPDGREPAASPSAGEREAALADHPPRDQALPERSAPWVAGQPASLGKRAGAYIIDYLAVNAALAVIGVRSGIVPVTAETMTRDQAYAAGIVASIFALLYFVTLEAAFGRTLAKRMLGIRVAMADGSRVTVRAALTRRVLFFAGILIPVIGSLFNFAVPLAALITAIQDEPTGRGFHDRWARTTVVEASA